MSKNTNIADLINYISVDGSGNVVLSTGQLVATQNYVTTAVSNLVASAPSTLDTLNELATALGNDANFATTVTNSIATKLPLSGGTLTGALNGTSALFSNNLEVGRLGGAVTVGDLFVDSANNSVYVGRQSSTSGDNSKFYVRNRLNTLTALSVDPGGNGAVDVVGTFSTTRGTNLATATGNVGIANTSPATKLDVSGTIRSISQTDPTSGVGMELFYRAADTSSYIQSYDRSTDTWKDIRIFGNNLLFGTNGTERMRLTTTWPGTIGCLLVNKTTASSSYPIQTQSANGAYMASASGPGDANYYSTSPTIGYHFYGDQGGASKFNVTGAGKGYFASGVQFGSGSSTLNYYQEGSWTPQLYAGSTAFTMSGINDGRYVRVGNQVTISGHLQWSGGSGTGMVRIAGLPFTCSGVRSAGSMGAVSYGISFSSGYNHWILVVDPGTDYIYIIQGDSTGGGYSHNAPVGSSGVIYGFSITYHTL